MIKQGARGLAGLVAGDTLRQITIFHFALDPRFLLQDDKRETLATSH
jgi:hypothetical protein